MPDHYRAFLGLHTDPFRSDLRHQDILPTGELQSVANKIVYAAQLASAAIVTGDIGSGKSTAIRYAAAKEKSQTATAEHVRLAPTEIF